MGRKFSIVFLVLYCFIMSFGQGLTTDQRHLEDTVQRVLDRILGPNKSIVYISLLGEEEKWEVNYTAIPAIDGVDTEQLGGSGRRQTIVPGIPSLKFLTGEGQSDTGMPLNYEVVQRPAQIRNKEVVLILDKKIKIGDLRKARLFVTNFLGLNEEQGDKFTVLKEDFSNLEKASRSTQSVTTKKRSPWLYIVVVGIFIIILIAGAIILLKFLPSRTRHEGDGGAGAGSGAAGVSVEEKSEEELKAEEEEKTRLDEEEKIQQLHLGILGNGERYFNFIDDDNIYKLKFLLQVKIALQQATPRTIAVVMACLPFKLAASILVEYPSKIQAEIINNLLTLQHYPEKEMAALEQEIRQKISYIFGGKATVKLILEKLTGEDKKSILGVIESKYPGIADELNSLILLFDDLLQLETRILGRIFTDIDTEVIATALVNIEGELQQKVIETLPKGVQAMVDQWLSLKSGTASIYDIEQARQKILNYAQHLEKEGFVELTNG